MKKLTAALSAAAIAVTMAVPFTAGAATIVDEDFNADHGAQWSPNTYFNNVADGRFALSTDAGAKNTLSKTIDWSGKYTVTFKLITGDKTSGVALRMVNSGNWFPLIDAPSNGTYDANTLKVGNGLKTSQNVLYSGGGTAYLIPNKTYDCTISVDGSTASVDVAGEFKTAGKTVDTQAITIPQEVLAEGTSLSFTCYNNNGSANTYIDDIKIETEETAEPVKAATKTDPVNVAWSDESITVEGITITGTTTVICGDANVQFYRTDITAGDTAVNGGTIALNDQSKPFETKVAAGQTGSFYTAVTYKNDLPAITWTVTCNE